MKYNRVLLKISGESFKGKKEYGIDFEKVLEYAKVIKECKSKNVEVAVVIGGGNIWRGRDNQMMNSCASDDIGMLATVMNAISLKEALLQLGEKAEVLTSIQMDKIATFYNRETALNLLNHNVITIFASGIANPCFSTDTTAALRAIEINADIILKSTNVDGVYDSDPKKNIDAVKLNNITYHSIIENNLNVIDLTAASLCLEHNVPMLIFNGTNPYNIINALEKENIGTLINN